MGTLATADALAALDIIAAMSVCLNTAYGTGVEADSISKGAVDISGDITTAAAADLEISTALGGAVADLVASTLTTNADSSPLGTFIRKIELHEGGDINDWLDTAGEKVQPQFSLYGIYPRLQAVNICPPATAMGTYAKTTGVFTDGSAIDTDLYGGGKLEVKATGGAIGIADLVLTITYEDDDGNTESLPVTIPSGTLEDAVVAVPNCPYVVDVTACTHTGGTDGDTVTIQTKLDRALPAISA